jgi:hypothetical protein
MRRLRTIAIAPKSGRAPLTDCASNPSIPWWFQRRSLGGQRTVRDAGQGVAIRAVVRRMRWARVAQRLQQRKRRDDPRLTPGHDIDTGRLAAPGCNSFQTCGAADTRRINPS